MITIPDLDAAHDRADSFVASMNLLERVVWLQRQGFTDTQVLDALLDPDDHELDEFARDAAHGVASAFVNGNLEDVPSWLLP